MNKIAIAKIVVIITTVVAVNVVARVKIAELAEEAFAVK